MPSKVTALPVRRTFGETMRTDAWWLQPVVVFVVFTSFVIYSTWAAFQGNNYYSGNLLSPFYSPLIWGDPEAHSFTGTLEPGWWPSFLPVFSPAFVILWAPVSFRLTCYYYRGAYYKAYWPGPSSCSVGTPREAYMGERNFPLILQNAHRYTLPFALLLLVFLSHDAWKALWFQTESGSEKLGLSLGTIVLTANVVLLSGYTFGCHSLRHLIGGGIDKLAGRPVQRAAYECVSWCNGRHMIWAWCSLIWVSFTDIYVRLCAMGIWADWRIL